MCVTRRRVSENRSLPGPRWGAQSPVSALSMVASSAPKEGGVRVESSGLSSLVIMEGGATAAPKRTPPKGCEGETCERQKEQR